jgi:hypothetical protein
MPRNREIWEQGLVVCAGCCNRERDAMKEAPFLAVVIGGFALLYLAVKSGWIGGNPNAAIPVGRGVYAPQPAQNYSGYLAASTAPGVSDALNGLLSGVGGALSGWLHTRSSNSPAPNVQAAAPTGAYQAASTGIGPSNPLGISDSNNPMLWTDPLAYDNTGVTSFAYDALAADNAYDPTYSLMLDPSLLPA